MAGDLRIVPHQPVAGRLLDLLGVQSLDVHELRPFLGGQVAGPVHHQVIVPRPLRIPFQFLVLVERHIVADLLGRRLRDLVLGEKIGVDQGHLVKGIERVRRSRLVGIQAPRFRQLGGGRGIELLERILGVDVEHQPRRIGGSRRLRISLILGGRPDRGDIANQGGTALRRRLAIDPDILARHHAPHRHGFIRRLVRFLGLAEGSPRQQGKDRQGSQDRQARRKEG